MLTMTTDKAFDAVVATNEPIEFVTTGNGKMVRLEPRSNGSVAVYSMKRAEKLAASEWVDGMVVSTDLTLIGRVSDRVGLMNMVASA